MNDSIEIKLTKRQAEDIIYRLGIIADEPDLLDDYGMTEDEARTLEASVPIKGGAWQFEERHRPMLHEEIEFVADIDHANWQGGYNEGGEYRSSSNLEKKLRGAS